ncbi:MAG: septal ring lytic transglycosylase RlpA family protein, partial [Woeseiaceae bacterium]|nr:septal ring lytic transglycosylase RlpA family protein [Woeseiaceae bacterium]
RDEPLSRYGTGPVYEVLGRRYAVLPTSNGYKERGVASWYGKKFHGRLTSNRETYDMYAMTAAHKTLPLPTYVRVRNLRNDKSVVVRINDRGPFVHNRIIDLSYAAAVKLDMIRDGTSLVEVTVVNAIEDFGDQPGRRVQAAPPPVAATASAAAPVPADPLSPTIAADPPPDSSQAITDVEHDVYVQVGAFGSRENAERRHRLLLDKGIGTAFIHTDTSVTPALYRVRVGPIAEVIQYDILVEELENLGILDPYLVTD